ncbi:Hpt domain-containing protein [Jannaschia sp. Os4]|uniref:chemotaxis protein CheA n=1 Tax=Jannaschia sp. Os4 TaxID=2807617 RepID=UPI001939F3B2|nr:ATP-binding protein [Jannaschia sp. Os4]MBM2576484.1 Hpt domain-containing protein [Jannaschia sp. Os4]
MTVSDPAMDALSDDFVEEAVDLLAEVDAARVALRDGRAPGEAIDAAFRAIHTIKGGAGLVGLDEVASHAHALEERLAAVRGGEASTDGLHELLASGGDDLRRALAPDAEADRPASTPAFRVRPDRADRLASLSADLALHEAALRRALPPVRSDDALAPAAERLHISVQGLRDAVIDLRAQPVAPLLARMAALGRDTARALGKTVRVDVEGDDVEIDAGIVERLAGPLTHLVRNAVDHGIEVDRAAVGKPSEGRIVLGAVQSGDTVVIEVSDDGRGIDVATLRARAGPEAPAAPAGGDILSLAARPGLSTRDHASGTSGRGVGLDAVMREIGAIAGASAQLESSPGVGCRFRLTLPTTISVIDGLVCEAGGMVVVIPLAAVRGTHPAAAEPGRPVIELGRMLRPDAPAGDEIVELVGPDAPFVGVDRVVASGTSAVRPLPDATPRPGWIAGGIVGDDGRVGVVVDPRGLSAGQAA